MKHRREISLDPDVDKVIDEKTQKGEICASRYINAHFREKYKNELEDDKKEQKGKKG